MGKTLVIRSRNAGFFSNLNCVLNNLEVHLAHGEFTAAEVIWDARQDLAHFSYGRPEDGNTWLHFFEPLPFSHLPAARKEVSEYAPAATHISSNDAYATYKLNPFWRRHYHRLFTSYIRVKPFLRDRAEAIHRANMAGKRCVGVHYRHPAHDVENLFPIPSPTAFIEHTRRLLPPGQPYAVFLATDFEPAAAAFRAAFGAALVLQPGVSRAATQEQIHEGAPDPALTLGEQVLVDCLLLARCDVLLHVTSNVATAAGYINPRLKMVYCESPAEACYGYLWSVMRLLTWRFPAFQTFIGWCQGPHGRFLTRCRGALRRRLSRFRF